MRREEVLKQGEEARFDDEMGFQLSKESWDFARHHFMHMESTAPEQNIPKSSLLLWDVT